MRNGRNGGKRKGGGGRKEGMKGKAWRRNGGKKERERKEKKMKGRKIKGKKRGEGQGRNKRTTDDKRDRKGKHEKGKSTPSDRSAARPVRCPALPQAGSSPRPTLLPRARVGERPAGLGRRGTSRTPHHRLIYITLLLLLLIQFHTQLHLQT